MSDLPSISRYYRHLEATAEWLVRSIRHGNGGSCASYTPLLGWSRPYPETTGYLIPTLLRFCGQVRGHDWQELATSLGDWLLAIQLPDGAWQGGLYPTRGEPRPSVFNTGQILKGMMALFHADGDSRWLDAAARGAMWLAEGVTASGQWSGQDYRSASTPTYYTHVAWPMLEVWSVTGEEQVRMAAERVLQYVLSRRRPDGSFAGWAFGDGQAAFTHTMAYTLRGLLESARLLDAWDWCGEPTVSALTRLARQAELCGGRLSGAYRDGWKADRRYSCLTGNAQLAICLLLWEQRELDLRLVNAAAKLVDFVCSRQRLRSLLPGIQGAVAGSSPMWQSYMRFRYPNWAAKYHCDAMLLLIDRLNIEMEVQGCASSSRPALTALGMC
jgi:hypothetical protein